MVIKYLTRLIITAPSAVVQRQTAVTAYFSSKQLLLRAFAIPLWRVASTCNENKVFTHSEAGEQAGFELSLESSCVGTPL